MTMSDTIMRALDKRGIDVEVADRLGFASVNRTDLGGDCLVIPFVRAGEIVRRKYRTLGGEKRFTQDKGGVRCAWNEDCLRDDELLGRPLIITEGELDGAVAIQCGFPRTISVPDGAPPPGDRSKEDLDESAKYEWLRDIAPLTTRERCPEIVLAVDGDDNGAALLHDLATQFGRFRCKFLTYPKARDPEGRGRVRLKDLNEVFEDYGLKGVTETVAKAQWIRVDGVYRMSDLPPLPPSQMFDIGFESLSEHYKLRLGDFAVWTGIPGHGKSTFVHDMLCRVVERHGLKIAWASFEQPPQRDHRRAFRTWYNRQFEVRQTTGEIDQADAWIDRHHVFLVPGEHDDVTLEWFLEKAEVAVVRHGCKVIVIDPWNEMDHMWGHGETEAQYINRSIKTLRRFARAFQVHLILVAHPIKQQKREDGTYPMPGLYDINGGAVWHNKADLGAIVYREDEENTKVKVAKSRYHEVIGTPGSVRMHFCAQDRRFREMEHMQ